MRSRVRPREPAPVPGAATHQPLDLPSRPRRPLGVVDFLKEAERAGRDYELRIWDWTEEEFMKHAPENRFCDLIDGELIVHSPVRTIHQRLVAFLTYLLITHTSARTLGEVLNGPAATRLRPGAVVEPDIFYISTDRLAAIGDLHVEAAPDFCVEVLSPSTRRHDLVEKAALYVESGVGECWFVDGRDRRVVVHRALPPRLDGLEVRAGRLEAVAVPGFWIEVDWLWQTPLPSAASLAPLYLTR